MRPTEGAGFVLSASPSPFSASSGFIFSAAAHAQRAVAYLHDQQPKATDVEEAA
jgi:uracil DNA glycosylase